MLVVKNSPANEGDAADSDLTPESRRFPGGRHGSELQYFCLENLMDREACWAIFHRVASTYR